MQQLHSHLCGLPQELISKALALTWRTIEDMEEPEFVHRTQWFKELYNWRLNWFLSIEKFCFYLLSPEFIEKYIPIIIEEVYLWEYNSDFDADPESVSCEYFWTAIYEYQKWNSQPLIDLLEKIW